VLGADLVLKNGISNFFRKPANSLHIHLVFLVASGAGAVGDGLQLVFDPFESTGIRSTRALGHNGWCSLEQDRSSLGLIIITHGAHSYSEPTQPSKRSLYLSPYPR